MVIPVTSFPRVFHLPTLEGGREMKDPGDEVGFPVSVCVQLYKYLVPIEYSPLIHY